ncbi:MAG: Crp/Fnr family transcriptional regulator [Bacteroidales bacterium]|nr:Crp/Fnr family transcriptional regulator [Bacteroidales bacterium]
MEKFQPQEIHLNNDKCKCDECILRSIVISNLPPEVNDRMCRLKQEKVFQKGEIIISENDPIEYFFYLKKGLIKLSKLLDNQKNYILILARPHDYISLLSIFHRNTYNYSMTAIEECEVCIFPMEEIQQLLITYPDFTLAFLRKVNKTSDVLIERFLTFNSRNLRGRIALILLEFSEKIYQSRAFEVPISRREIAELIGMTTENVIRILSEFKNENIIKISGKEIEIVDPDKLRLIAEHG